MSPSSEQLARHIYDELLAATGGRPFQWITLQPIADRLKVDVAGLQKAVNLGVDFGWFDTAGAPTHRVCLNDKGRGQRLSQG